MSNRRDPADCLMRTATAVERWVSCVQKQGPCQLAKMSPNASSPSAWQLWWDSCRRMMSHLSLCCRLESVYRLALLEAIYVEAEEEP